MIITFIGHAKLAYDQNVADKLIKVLEDVIEGQDVTFYMGMNGNFDYLARECCLQYKKKHGNAKLVFVTPYLNEDYLKSKEPTTLGFDEVLYPDLEHVPKRYAIAARNKYMIDRVEVLVAFASLVFGNAHKYLFYSYSKCKECINLEDL